MTQPVTPAAGGTIRDLIGRHAAAGAAEASAGIPTLQVPLDVIDDNPFQYRNEMDPEKLDELAASIASSGLMQPVILRRAVGGRWQTIAGHRRRAAYTLLRERAPTDSEKDRWRTIPAIERVGVTDEELERLALEENFHREDPSALASAGGLAHYASSNGLSTADLAERLHLELTRVKRLLRLNSAPDVIKQGVTTGLMVPLFDDGLAIVNESGRQRHEHRRLDFLAALEFYKLFEFWAADNPRRAIERTEAAIRRALQESWGLRRVTTYCGNVIKARREEKVERPADGSIRGRLAWRESTDRGELTVSWKRLAAAPADQRAALRALLEERFASLDAPPASPAGSEAT